MRDGGEDGHPQAKERGLEQILPSQTTDTRVVCAPVKTHAQERNGVGWVVCVCVCVCVCVFEGAEGRRVREGPLEMVTREVQF